MSTSMLYVTFDCHEPVKLASFWATVFSYDLDTRNAAFGEAEITDPTGGALPIMFLKVPEGKTVKNRVHLDLSLETPMEAEVERLVAAGPERCKRIRTQRVTTAPTSGP